MFEIHSSSPTPKIFTTTLQCRFIFTYLLAENKNRALVEFMRICKIEFDYNGGGGVVIRTFYNNNKWPRYEVTPGKGKSHYAQTFTKKLHPFKKTIFYLICRAIFSINVGRFRIHNRRNPFAFNLQTIEQPKRNFEILYCIVF